MQRTPKKNNYNYVNQALDEQNFLDNQFSFPANTAPALTKEEYQTYFSRLGEQLSLRQQVADQLVLTRGNEALAGLLAYLDSVPPLLFKALEIKIAAPLDPLFLQILEKLSASGLSALKLTIAPEAKITLDDSFLEKLAAFIQEKEIAVALELPPDMEQAQLALEELTATARRKKMRQLFKEGAAVQEANKIAVDINKVTRKRNPLAKSIISVDVEMQEEREAAIELETSTAIEKAIEEHFEDKAIPEFINRAEFLRRVKEKEFKVEHSCYEKIAGHEKRSFDHWLGNASQWVVQPRKKVGVFFKPIDFHEVLLYDYVYRFYGFTAVELIQARSYSKFTNFPLTPEEKHKFYKVLYPEFCTVDSWDQFSWYQIYNKLYDIPKLSAQQVAALNEIAPVSPYLLPQFGAGEQWKGKYIYDATTVPEDEKSIEQLKSDCPIKFEDPEVVGQLNANPNLGLLTPKAAEVLLQHQDQFQYGVDLEHPTDGFELVETEVAGKTTVFLDFNVKKARVSRKDPLAIQLRTPPVAEPFSWALIAEWLQTPCSFTEEQQLRNCYQALRAEGSRPKLAEFRKLLPLLLLMPAAAIQQAKTADELIAAVKQSQKDLEKQPALPAKHLLFRFLQNHPTLLERLAQWNTLLNFTQADLNRLLTVYDAYGEEGLAALFTSWEKMDPSVLAHLQKNYFPHCCSLRHAVDDKAYAAAITTLCGLSPDERAFWNALFEQHCATVGYDNLVAMVEAFQAFVKKIGDKQLSFYSPCDFPKGVKSLPVALSRMLTILNNTAEMDLKCVWEQITHFDLQSNAAIRLITDIQRKPGASQLLLPEMLLEPTGYYAEHDYALDTQTRATLEKPHGYQAIQVAHPQPNEKFYASCGTLHELLASSSRLNKEERQLELKRNYYRYLSMQEQRLSLGFYQKAAKTIDNLMADSAVFDYFQIRKKLYALVAAATTGLEASSCLHNEETSLLEVEKICRELKGITQVAKPDAWLQEEILHQYFIKGMTAMAPLPYLCKLMAIARKGLSVSASREPTDKFFKNIFYLTDIHKYAFYQGTRFLDEEKASYEDYFRFAELGRQLTTIKDFYPYSTFGKTIASALTSLMSTFQFNDSIQNQLKPVLCNIDRNRQFGKLLAAGLQLLARMSTNRSASGQPLQQADLLKFFEKMNTRFNAQPLVNLDALALELVKQEYAAYFKPGFFEELLSQGLAVDIEAQIKKSFETSEEQKAVSETLLSFKTVADSFQRPECIKRLQRITATLSSRERSAFLKALSTLNTRGDNTQEELNDLLAEVAKRGNLNDFVFMLERAQLEPAASLISRITTYYQHALPLIYYQRPKSVSLVELQPLVARLILNVDESGEEFKSFFEKLQEDLYPLIVSYPNEKPGVLAFLDQYISAVKMEKPSAAVSGRISEFLKLMNTTVVEFRDANLLCSLCDHYREKPLELHKLLQLVEKLPEKKDQHFVLSMVTALLNNGRECTLEQLQEFLTQCTTHNELLGRAKTFFENPPYPTLPQVFAWHTMEKNERFAVYVQQMDAHYAAYNLKPCERESGNGFKLAEALTLAPQFEGITFEETVDFTPLVTAIESVENNTVAQLKAGLATFMKLDTNEQAKQGTRLLAILTQLLYRSKGATGGKGKSYEINTIQYMALLSFLKSKGHITSEMATGEGKSRVMMLAAASQWALGKTVDFVTSDLALAQRDYLEYQAFFKIIGAGDKISLISANSPINAYRIKGINFSDVDSLNLFRNQAKSRKEGASVLDPIKKDRALCLDEGDRTYFDMSENRFNYSSESNDNIKKMEWVYPVLVRYFTQKNPHQAARVKDIYENDIDGCSKEFMAFFERQAECTPENKARLQALSARQLESWQEAAVAALQLQLGDDYALELNVLIETAKGPKVASEARLIAGHRISRNSKFSFGVHQCLHAYLNEALKDPESVISKKCAALNKQEALLHKKPEGAIQPFFLHPEKQIIYSTTAKTFLDEYAEGCRWSVTGTGGAPIEREEAAALYGQEGQETHPMEFVTVPRKNILRRIDNYLRLTGNFAGRIDALLEYIIEARTAKRPVLLICENDKEAEAISAALQKHPKAAAIAKNQWKYVDSTSSLAEEKEAIDNAGKPGIVTISTSRLGRGTDIKLSPEAEEKGLRVLCSYLPRERDLLQILGRAGRFGAAGDTRLIVDKEQLCKMFGIKELDTDFFLSNEFYLKTKQMHFDRKKQAERLVRHALSDFRFPIVDNFFKYLDSLKALNDKERDDRLTLWSDFYKKVDHLWNQTWPDLAYLVGQPKPDMPKIKAHLAKFKDEAQEEWNNFYQKLPGDKANLPEKLNKLELDPRTEHLLRRVMSKRKYTVEDRTQVYQTYDKALDGRAAVYDQLFAETRAWLRGERCLFANTRAWWNNHGLLFANTRAWWAGKRPLFANLRAWLWLNREKAKKAVPVNQRDIMDALDKHDRAALKHFITKLNTAQWLKSKKGDPLISFKIDLVESILAYAHREGDHITDDNMNFMRELLEVVKPKDTTGPQENLVSAVKTKVQASSNRFFSSSLRKNLDTLIQEQEKREVQPECSSVNR